MTDTRALAARLRDDIEACRSAAKISSSTVNLANLVETAEALSTLSTENAGLKRQLDALAARFDRQRELYVRRSHEVDVLSQQLQSLADAARNYAADTDLELDAALYAEIETAQVLLGSRHASRPSNTGKE